MDLNHHLAVCKTAALPFKLHPHQTKEQISRAGLLEGEGEVMKHTALPFHLIPPTGRRVGPLGFAAVHQKEERSADHYRRERRRQVVEPAY